MAMHSTNSLLKYVVPLVMLGIVIVIIMPYFRASSVTPKPVKSEIESSIKNVADHDSATESLETLTATLSETKQQIANVAKNNEELKLENTRLAEIAHSKEATESNALSTEVKQLKSQIDNLMQNRSSDYVIDNSPHTEAITTVSDLSIVHDERNEKNERNVGMSLLEKTSVNPDETSSPENEENITKPEVIPYYTIPANGTSVKDQLMTALVGRIPVKGIVTDPYPFKIVISDDNLAANGLRVPHLLQMVVSGYCEGDLNLMSVRGWITSLTFVFDDGTISTTTSNDNDIGNFTKANSLGYLSDEYGNPFIRGRLISNAPTYLSGNVALGTATGLANAYSLEQTTATSSPIGGTNTTTVTGSQGKFVAGQAVSTGMNEASQWWHDREQQSFDAIYVPTTDEKCRPVKIAVNFAKEIHIDYNIKGRKLSYAEGINNTIHTSLD